MIFSVQCRACAIAQAPARDSTVAAIRILTSIVRLCCAACQALPSRPVKVHMDNATLEALRTLEVQRAASDDARRSSAGSASGGTVYRYTARTSVEEARRHAEAMACERRNTKISDSLALPTPPATAVAPPTPPATSVAPPTPPPAAIPAPPSAASAATAAMAAALEADEADDPIAALPRYIEAAEAYMAAVSAAPTAEHAAKWSKQARSCVERAEELKPLKERAEAERELQRRVEMLSQRERELAALPAAARLLPTHWDARDELEYAADGFVLAGIDVREHSSTWAALGGLLHTEHSGTLGIGRDVVHSASRYSSLRLACAWRVQHPHLWARFETGKAQLRRDVQRLEALGKGLGGTPAGLPVLTEDRAAGLAGARDPEAREQWLLHGTKPESLLAILAHGPNERFSSGLFGNGTYFGEARAVEGPHTRRGRTSRWHHAAAAVGPLPPGPCPLPSALGPHPSTLCAICRPMVATASATRLSPALPTYVTSALRS